MTLKTPTVRFQRANFVVADLDRALSLYCDVLGFEVAFRHGHNPDSYSYPVFDIPQEAQLGFAVLSLPGQPRVMALTEVSGIAHSAPTRPRRSAIVLDVSDVDGVVSQARALGLTVYPEEVLETHDGRFGREVGIVDFDDNLLVVYRIS